MIEIFVGLLVIVLISLIAGLVVIVLGNDVLSILAIRLMYIGVICCIGYSIGSAIISRAVGI